MKLQADSWSGVTAAMDSFRKRINIGGAVLRAAAIALFATAIMLGPVDQKAFQDICSTPPKEGCFVPPRIDLAFVIDASGSLENRGQTYNVAIEGVVRALRDPATVPRDGSMAVSVTLFNGPAEVIVPLTDINSASDAQDLADHVAAFLCEDIHSDVFPPCPFGETLYFQGIRAADDDITDRRNSSPKPGGLRIMLLATDGQPNDLEAAVLAVEKARVSANTQQNQFEFDVFLTGHESDSADPAKLAEFQAAKAVVDQLVFPKPAGSLPGATVVIEGGDCNLEGASLGSSDCARQVSDFAAQVRKVIRQGVTPLSLVVNSEGDTAADEPIAGDSVSLRQAIEAANCNGGDTNITFDESLDGHIIQLTEPLPAITQPNTVINGCAGPDCSPSITIDGEGEIADGIAIRSNGIRIQGVKLINFTRAGIVSTPVCPSDFISRNVIEDVVFETTPTAVLMFDDRAAPREGFNEQTRISRITATRNAQPADAEPTALIDLGGDGPTPNDVGDTDEGPNTLMNFPDSINVVANENGTVTISGQVSGPTAPGATVEIYSITKSHIVDGSLVVDGVAFLAATTAGTDCPPSGDLPACAFTAAGIDPSPTGNYTATVIDSLGNTSEFMFRSDGKPAGGPSASFVTPVDFGAVNVNSAPQTKNIVVTNDGNAPLLISDCEIARCDPEDPNDTARFTLAGCPAEGAFINPGQAVTVMVTFATNICGPAKACLVLQNNDLLHSPIIVTLTGSVGGNSVPVVTLEGNASVLEFGPVTARNKPRKPKKFKKMVSRTFTVANNGCNALTLSFDSITRETEVDRCDISTANADDSRLWVVSQIKSSGDVRIPIGTNVPIAQGETLTFRVGFNPAVPVVVNSNCSSGELKAIDFLPDEVDSLLSIRSSGGQSTPATFTIPLHGEVTKEIRLIHPTNPGNAPLVRLCRSGDLFTVEFSAYDANGNIDRATYQFRDSSGRIVGQAFDISLSQAIADRELATGQSVTVSQKFTGASDNSEVVGVQVTVFEGDGSSSSGTANQITTGCSAGQSAPPTPLGSAFRRSRK